MIRFFVLFFFILTTISFAEIKKVNIIGNSRVNSNTIESLVDKKITNVDSIFINNLTKKIYDTEFFSDVKISYNQDTLTITVVENPIVNFFYINGVKDSDLDQINKIITLMFFYCFRKSCIQIARVVLAKIHGEHILTKMPLPIFV